MNKNSSYSYHNPRYDGDPKNGSGDDDNDGCCSIPCLKFSLHLFNILLLLTGVAFAVVGLSTALDQHPALRGLLSSGVYDLVGYVIVVAGERRRKTMELHEIVQKPSEQKLCSKL